MDGNLKYFQSLLVLHVFISLVSWDDRAGRSPETLDFFPKPWSLPPLLDPHEALAEVNLVLGIRQGTF